MIMVSDMTSNNYTRQERPSWGNVDNFSALLNRNDAPSGGLLRMLSEKLRSQR